MNLTMIKGTCFCGSVTWQLDGQHVAAWLSDVGYIRMKEASNRIAVNLRLSEPTAVAHIPIDHFDGLETFDDLPRDGKFVADYWF